MTVETRIDIEKKIIRHMVELAIAKGWVVSVYDSEEWTLESSKDIEAIMNAVMTTDEDLLRFYDKENTKRIGTVYLVYGNSGWDVICDYTVSDMMEQFMEEVSKFSEAFENVE